MLKSLLSVQHNEHNLLQYGLIVLCAHVETFTAIVHDLCGLRL